MDEPPAEERRGQVAAVRDSIAAIFNCRMLADRLLNNALKVAAAFRR